MQSSLASHTDYDPSRFSSVTDPSIDSFIDYTGGAPSSPRAVGSARSHLSADMPYSSFGSGTSTDRPRTVLGEDISLFPSPPVTPNCDTAEPSSADPELPSPPGLGGASGFDSQTFMSEWAPSEVMDETIDPSVLSMDTPDGPEPATPSGFEPQFNIELSNAEIDKIMSGIGSTADWASSMTDSADSYVDYGITPPPMYDDSAFDPLGPSAMPSESYDMSQGSYIPDESLRWAALMQRSGDLQLQIHSAFSELSEQISQVSASLISMESRLPGKRAAARTKITATTAASGVKKSRAPRKKKGESTVASSAVSSAA